MNFPVFLRTPRALNRDFHPLQMVNGVYLFRPEISFNKKNESIIVYPVGKNCNLWLTLRNHSIPEIRDNDYDKTNTTKVRFIRRISAVSNSIQRIKFNRNSTSESAAALLPHVRLVLSHYPTEMRHRFKRRISAVSNLIHTLCKCIERA